MKVKKPLQNPKRKEPGGCLPAASRLEFFSVPDVLVKIRFPFSVCIYKGLLVVITIDDALKGFRVGRGLDVVSRQGFIF